MIFSKWKQTILLGSLGAISLLSTACDEGTIPIFPAKVNDAGSADGGIEAGAIVRTVETRNPFGDTANPNNLMVDGDFELTGRSEQMPWVTFTQSGQSTLDYATGGQCKSGVRCASLAAGTQLIGYFASPKTDSMNASVWVRPPATNCDDVQVVALDLNDQQGGVAATLRASAPDASGWCNFTGSIPNLADKQPVLYITVADGSARTALIDDGVILPAAGSSMATSSNVKMSSVMRERVRFIGDWVRTHRRF